MSKTKLLKPATLSGFQDLLPEEAALEQKMIRTLEAVFQKFAYAPIKTPHLEYTEMLINETGGEIGKQLFRFEDNGGRDVCLRYDLTVPMSRYVVQHQNALGLPFKRYAIGSCFRGERPQQGRFREFTQCDFDILGVDSVLADLEIAQVIAAGFTALGIEAVTIKVNSREVLNGLIDFLGLSPNATELIRVFDKRDKISADQFNRELMELGCNDERLALVNELFSLISHRKQDPQQLFTLLKEKVSGEKFLKALARIEQLFTAAEQQPDLLKKLKFDLTLARGLGYYTGVIFETILNKAKAVGSVSGGGRYNDLTKSFSKTDIPGVGASFGISRIIAGLKMQELEFPYSKAQVLVGNFTQAAEAQVVEITSKLRAAGISTECYLEVAKFKKQLKYASNNNIKYMVVVDEQELADGLITLKNLEDNTQQQYTSADRLVKKAFLKPMSAAAADEEA